MGLRLSRKPCAPFARTISRVLSTLEEDNIGGEETRGGEARASSDIVGPRARNPCAPFARTISRVLSMLEEDEVGGGES